MEQREEKYIVVKSGDIQTIYSPQEFASIGGRFQLYASHSTAIPISSLATRYGSLDDPESLQGRQQYFLLESQGAFNESIGGHISLEALAPESFEREEIYMKHHSMITTPEGEQIYYSIPRYDMLV